MSNRKIKIYKDPYGTGVNLFSKDEITISTGINTLIGCNGSGKTTLLKSIEEYLKKEKIKYFKYSNYKDGGSNASSFYSFEGNTQMLATNMLSSEGEEIYNNLGMRFLRKIGKYIRSNPDEKEIWFLIDSIDSGLSIDNIEEVKELFNEICKSNKEKDYYFVIAANNFELVYDTIAISVNNFNIEEFKHDEYLRYVEKIKKSKENKINRIEKEIKKQERNDKNV